MHPYLPNYRWQSVIPDIWPILLELTGGRGRVGMEWSGCFHCWWLTTILSRLTNEAFYFLHNQRDIPLYRAGIDITFRLQ